MVLPASIPNESFLQDLAYYGFQDVDPFTILVVEWSLSLFEDYLRDFKSLDNDLVTKIKALNEFQDLAEKLGEAEMLAVLTYWPSVFNKLATDIEGRIRELSFIVHKIVVTWSAG